MVTAVPQHQVIINEAAFQQVSELQSIIVSSDKNFAFAPST